MNTQATEILRGTLEGIVLANLGSTPILGSDIGARLRQEGFTDIPEGTVYAALIRVQQRGLADVGTVPSRTGPPRKVYSLTATGREQLADFWRIWGSFSNRLNTLHSTDTPNQ